MSGLQIKQRIRWVDCAKGMTMLLVIIGHTVTKPAIRGIIFSFHMPLFFLLSGYTFSLSCDLSQWMSKQGKAFTKLLVPAFLVYFVRLPFLVLQDKVTISVRNILLTLLFSSGTETSIAGCFIPAMGMMWFLVALFLLRALYDGLHLLLHGKYMFWVACTASVSGYLISRVVYLPFSLDIVLTANLFFCFGQAMKHVGVQKHCTIMLCSGAVWAISFSGIYFFSRQYLELASRHLPLFPLCFVTAAAGCLTVICICIMLEKKRFLGASRLFSVMCYFGENSMQLYMIHALDLIWYSYLEETALNVAVLTLLRLLTDTAMLLIWVWARRNIFSKARTKGA